DDARVRAARALARELPARVQAPSRFRLGQTDGHGFTCRSDRMTLPGRLRARGVGQSLTRWETVGRPRMGRYLERYAATPHAEDQRLAWMSGVASASPGTNCPPG